MNKDCVYNAAIVGCGRIASLFDNDPKRKFIATHAGAYVINKRIRLISASDTNKARLENFGRKWHVKKLYLDYNEMLANEDIDILSICTWSDSHFAIARDAIDEGIRAIFCEKPIVDNLGDAERFVTLCKRKRVVLAINHRRRWDALHYEIRKFIVNDTLGDIQSIDGFYTGGIANSATHLFDILRFFFGDVSWVWAYPNKNMRVEKDPNLGGYIWFQKGIGCHIHALEATHYMIFELDIYGTKGRLRVENNGGYVTLWKVIPSPEFSECKILALAKSPFKGGSLNKAMVNAVSNIVGCLDGREMLLSTGDDGRKALEIVYAFHKSANLSKVIELPLKGQ